MLNERPDVAPATREAVRRAVQEQGFASNGPNIQLGTRLVVRDSTAAPLTV